MRIIDYFVQRSLQLYDLQKFVGYYIKDGWQPCGGIFYDGVHYLQAMVKCKEN